MYKLMAVVVFAAVFAGCSSTGGPISFGKPASKGFKPASEVATWCRPMVEGRMTLAECMQLPESKADGGRACVLAIQDIPARSGR